MKSIFYLVGIIVLVVLFGFLMIGKANGSNSIGTAPVKNGVQEITLGLKNYNYYPNTVKVKANVPVRIYLDNSVGGCLRDFTIRDFGVHKYLKTPNDYVEFTPTQTGKHTFACSMGMGTGVLIVE